MHATNPKPVWYFLLLMMLLSPAMVHADTLPHSPLPCDTSSFAVSITVANDNQKLAAAKIKIGAAEIKVTTNEKGLAVICLPMEFKNASLSVVIRHKGKKKKKLDFIFEPGSHLQINLSDRAFITDGVDFHPKRYKHACRGWHSYYFPGW